MVVTRAAGTAPHLGRDERPRSELGAGLVELLVAAALGLLGLAVVATVARGPLRASVAAASASPAIGAVDLVRQVTAGAVRAAAADASGPAVLAAGPDHLVLRVTVANGGPGWWRIASAPDGSIGVSSGAGTYPGGAEGRSPDAHDLPVSGPFAFGVLDVEGMEIAGPGAGPRSPGDAALARAALVEVRRTDEDGTRTVVVALRPAS